MSADRQASFAWGAGTLLLLSLGLAGWAFHQRQHVQAEAAELANSKSNLEAAIKHAQAVLDGRKQAETAAKAKALAQLRAAQASSPTMPNGRPDFDAIVSSHPDLLAMYVKAARGYLAQTWGATFARLHLSGDQVDQMETLMIDDMENSMDLNAAIQSQGLSYNDPAAVTEREKQAADLQAAEVNVIGQQAYDAFDAVSRANAVRGTVEQVASMTTFSAAPLTGEQSEQLTQVMAQSSTDYQSGKKATAATVNWNAVLSQAPAFLSPTQVATLQGVAQQNQFNALAKTFAAQKAPAN